MLKITGTETHRIGNKVHVSFKDENGTDVYSGGRYVDAADWDADPNAVVASVYDLVDKSPKLPDTEIRIDAKIVEMTKAEVLAKLAAEKK